MKKKILLIMLGITSLSSIAQIKNENSDIKVSAVIKSGCFISMQNIVFGEVKLSSFIKRAAPLKIQCSKGTSVDIKALSKVNPEGFRGFYMTIGAKEILPKGNVEKTAGQGVQYFLITNEVKSVPNEYNLIYKHDANILASVVIPGYDYTLKLKILTENEVIVPTEGLITESNRLVLAPGAYSDQLSMELTY